MIQGVGRPFIEMDDEELNREIVSCMTDLDSDGDVILRRMNQPEKYLFDLLQLEKILRN